MSVISPRDAAALRTIPAEGFEGYARRSPWPQVRDRVAACVALLVIMVGSGVVLGSTGER